MALQKLSITAFFFIPVYLLTCVSFDDAVSSADYIASDTMVNEKWIGKNLEESDHVLI
jgi:hypothetical protein